MNEPLDFLDLLNVLSFFVGLMNLQENLTQGDKQEILEQFNAKASELLNGIHAHLERQDLKLDDIQRKLEAIRIEKG